MTRLVSQISNDPSLGSFMVSKVAASTVMIPMTASQYADLGDFFVHYPKRATRSKKFEPVSNKFDRHDPEIN